MPTLSDDGLPPELDFVKDAEASSKRMNRAMTYLVGALRAAQAVKASYESVVEELRTLGLQRLNAALQPAFDQAAMIMAALQAHYAVYGYTPANRAGDSFAGAISAPSIAAAGVPGDAQVRLVKGAPTIAGALEFVDGNGAIVGRIGGGATDAPVQLTSSSGFNVLGGPLLLAGKPLRAAADSDAERWFYS